MSEKNDFVCLSASEGGKKDSKTTRERLKEKHFDFKASRFVYLLVWIFKSVPRWVLTQTSKVTRRRRKPCVQKKTLKVFGSFFGGSGPTVDCRVHTCWIIFTGRHLSFSFQAMGTDPALFSALMHSFAIFVQKKKRERKKKEKTHQRFSWDAVPLAANQ